LSRSIIVCSVILFFPSYNF